MVDSDEDISAERSTDWVNQVDRGGLLHDNELMRSIWMLKFCCHVDSENIEDTAISGICKSEKVLSYWELLSGMCEKEEWDYLLNQVAELWVTVRGYAYTSGWMEQQK